jgi:hypothetical protein
VNAAPDQAPPPGGWFYDKPLPWSLTAMAEAALGAEPENEPEAGTG